MSDILKPLAELEEKWRRSWSEIKDECADELAAVRAEMERKVAALTNGPTRAEVYQSGKNSRDKEVAGLQAELSKLRSQLAPCIDCGKIGGHGEHEDCPARDEAYG